MGQANEASTTNSGNQEASQVWAGQLCIAVQDGSLRFLFENKGTLFHGCRFEMLATLIQNCCPDSVSNAFTSLLSLFNNVQGEIESILEYRSHFDGLTHELARCKVLIPSILLVMLFLWALHGCHVSIVDQFRSHFKLIKTATIDFIVSNITYHDGFHVINHSKKGKPGSSPGPCVPAAELANTNANCQGKIRKTPFEWLAQYGIKGIKGRWKRAMASTGICPICHHDEQP